MCIKFSVFYCIQYLTLFCFMKYTYEPIFKGAACSCVNKARKRRLGGHCKAEMGGTYGLKRGSLCLCWTLK